MKAKIHAVELCGKTFLVNAITKQGAVRDLLEHLKDSVEVKVATGEQLFAAGRDGGSIIGEDRYKRAEDPNQIPLDGLDVETQEQTP